MSRPILFVVIGAASVAVIYLALCALLYFIQDDFIFYRVSNNHALANKWRARGVQIPSGSTTIEGWWADNANSSNNLTLLYFGGNAEDVLYTAESMHRFNARRMLVVNYRGYGATPGKPSEQALFEDALAAYDYAIKQPDVIAANLVVVGRSLGSGVATYVAAHRAARGVVLVTPYDSLASLAQEQFPYFPVRLLLKHKFASDTLARKITTPALLVAGEQDIVVPAVHAQNLADSWAGPKTIHILNGVGHNDIELHARYYSLINAFIERPLVPLN